MKQPDYLLRYNAPAVITEQYAKETFNLHREYWSCPPYRGDVAVEMQGNLFDDSITVTIRAAAPTKEANV